MVKNIAKEAIEDNKSSVDLCLLVSLDELEKQVKKVLPDGVILFSLHGALNLNSNIANLVHEGLVCSVYTLKCFENGKLYLLTTGVADSLP